MNGQSRSQSGRTAMTTAYALIIVGGVFLLRNLDLLPMRSNWWALLLLIPLFFLGARIMELRERHGGGFPPAARGALTGFLSIALVMVIFLLDLDWGDVWPLFIILVGVSFLFGGTGGRNGSSAPGGPDGGMGGAAGAPPSGPVS